MARLNLLERPQPALGILLACAGWGLSHQVGSESAFDVCATGGVVTVVASVIGLLICVAGGFYSLVSYRKAEGSGRHALAILGMLLALMTGFAVVLQIVASLILPPCFA